MYKGESEPPSIGNRASLFWSLDKIWVECESPSELRDHEYISYLNEDIDVIYKECKDAYGQAFGGKSLCDEIPIGLQAVIAHGFIIRRKVPFTEDEMRQLFQDYLKLSKYYEGRRSKRTK